MSSARLLVVLSASLAAALLLACSAPPDACSEPEAENVAVSLLALGDTGQPVPAIAWLAGQRRVGRALETAHRERPAQALVLLGDLFYPDGLTADQLVPRLRENLVAPYCRFLALTPRGRRELGDACPEPYREGAPVPVYAVLGNHDVEEPTSARVERELIPELIDHWRMPHAAHAYELAGGVSLIAFQSNPVIEGGDADAFENALRESKGPWRVVIAHHPIVNAGHEPNRTFPKHREYARRIVEIIARSGVSVHLFLSGHEHTLQALRGPGAALHVVSGAGSQARDIRATDNERLFDASELGFARVDLVGKGAEAQLHVALWSLGAWPYSPGHVLGHARPVACYGVGLDGSLF